MVADTDQDQHAKRLANAFAGADRALHRREHLAADEQGEGQAGRGAERIGEQQAGGGRAGAGQGRAGQDDAEDRPRAGRPQQAGGDTEQERAADPVFTALGRQPLARGRPAGASRAPTARGRSAAARRRQAGRSRSSGRRCWRRPPSRRRPRPGWRRAAKVIAMPASSGRPLRRNGRSARAKTNGSTGRMQGLRMVRMPPR